MTKLNYKEKDYKYQTNLNRVKSKEQIPDLFDSPPYSSGRNKEGSHKNKQKYFGKISGIEIMIKFEQEFPCRLFTKEELDLKKVKNKILEKLISSLV